METVPPSALSEAGTLSSGHAALISPLTGGCTADENGVLAGTGVFSVTLISYRFISKNLVFKRLLMQSRNANEASNSPTQPMMPIDESSARPLFRNRLRSTIFRPNDSRDQSLELLSSNIGLILRGTFGRIAEAGLSFSGLLTETTVASIPNVNASTAAIAIFMVNPLGCKAGIV
ncbi:MAG: hypothetical protein FWF44_03375 [Defluviitaleaceae bacterium]|nr:hypothetical protein [Defluviitaleaceae bacterium]